MVCPASRQAGKLTITRESDWNCAGCLLGGGGGGGIDRRGKLV